MRIGAMTTVAPADLDRLVRLGFRCFEWVRFADTAAGPAHAEWRGAAEAVSSAARERGLRISALSAFYRNPLDPRQTEEAQRAIVRAIEVAAHIGVRTVAGFAGGAIEWKLSERGGNPVYAPYEESLPALRAFWEPLARFAADRGVRIAFENCPQATWNLPIMGYNVLARPGLWERFFDATPCENLGLEWDPSHLVCQFIDPVANLRQFVSRVFHIHAKDAWVNRALLAQYGPCHPGVTEHRFPGLGEVDWAQVIHVLLRAGYDSDLNIEAGHDAVYRDHRAEEDSPMRGQTWNEDGLRIARGTLEFYVPQEEAP